MPLTDKKAILSVGWSREITVYDDSDPDVSISAPLLTPNILG